MKVNNIKNLIPTEGLGFEERCLKVVAIGDPHFKEKYMNVMVKFVDHVVDTVKKENPDFVVVLGDILDTMNIVTLQPHKLAVKFLKSLGEISETYVIIGNHDLMNNSQFLTDNHIFTPLKGLEQYTNVHIIDKPLVITKKGFNFAFCPYVPPGRFKEALNTLPIDVNSPQWEKCDCIFAHQEFKGAAMGAIISEEGDEWESYLPPVISGHIHDSQIIGSNIYYTGSSMQHSFSESEKKGTWVVSFEKDKHFDYVLVPNCFKTKKTLTLTVEEAKNYDAKTIPDDEEIRICVVDEPSNLQSFCKTKEKKDSKRTLV